MALAVSVRSIAGIDIYVGAWLEMHILACPVIEQELGEGGQTRGYRLLRDRSKLPATVEVRIPGGLGIALVDYDEKLPQIVEGMESSGGYCVLRGERAWPTEIVKTHAEANLESWRADGADTVLVYAVRAVGGGWVE